jgi:hypothetical protein
MPFGACGGGNDFVAVTQGDNMTKANTSKLNTNDPCASATRATSAGELSSLRLKETPAKIAAQKTAAKPKPGKIDKIVAMMRRPKGTSINDLAKATAWQAHSVRGAISGMLRKKQGFNVVSEKSGEIRFYRIVDKAAG